MSALIKKLKSLAPSFEQSLASKAANKQHIGSLAHTVVDKVNGTFDGDKVYDDFKKIYGTHPKLKDWKPQSINHYLKEKAIWNKNLNFHQEKYYILKKPSFSQAPYYNPFVPLKAQPLTDADWFLAKLCAGGMAFLGVSILLEKISGQEQDSVQPEDKT